MYFCTSSCLKSYPGVVVLNFFATAEFVKRSSKLLTTLLDLPAFGFYEKLCALPMLDELRLPELSCAFVAVMLPID